MSRRNLVVTVAAVHVFVLIFLALIGGCAKERKGVKLTTAGPAKEIRAPEAEPESILEPKGMVEEADLLVSREPETLPVKEEAPPAAKEQKPVVPEMKRPAVSEASKVQGVTHKVAAGDSLWKISRVYGISVADLARANNLKADATLKIGQVLVIPQGAPAGPKIMKGVGEKPSVGEERKVERKSADLAAGEANKHLIQKGETLSSISKRYGVAMEDLMEENEIEDPGKIKAGQTLVIPQ